MTPIKQPSIDAIAHSMNEYGAISVILSFVLLLLFVYFWKMINQRTITEKRHDKIEGMIATLLEKCQGMKEELIALRCLIQGSFRNKGWDDDNSN